MVQVRGTSVPLLRPFLHRTENVIASGIRRRASEDHGNTKTQMHVPSGIFRRVRVLYVPSCREEGASRKPVYSRSHPYTLGPGETLVTPGGHELPSKSIPGNSLGRMYQSTVWLFVRVHKRRQSSTEFGSGGELDQGYPQRECLCEVLYSLARFFHF